MVAAAATPPLGAARDQEPTRLLVLSDIHACAYGGPSYAPTDRRTDPFGELIKFLGDASVDFVLCAGDLANLADTAGLTFAWDRLVELARTLGAKLVATAGNHDLDSRLITDDAFDPREQLQALNPSFPFTSTDPSLDVGDRYWSRHYAILRENNLTVAVLNTCAFHGYGNLDAHRQDKEFMWGRVSNATVDRLVEDLLTPGVQGDSPPILLLHHHLPTSNPTASTEGAQLRNWNYLLEQLAKCAPDWLVVHGHLHSPLVETLTAHGARFTIISAASFARHPEALYPEHPGNQLHIVSLLNRSAAYAMSLSSPAGEIDTLTWNAAAHVWHRSNDGRGLPARCGFGAFEPADVITNTYELAVTTASDDRLDAAAIAGAFTKWQHVLPADRVSVARMLEARGIRSDLDAPEQAGYRDFTSLAKVIG